MWYLPPIWSVLALVFAALVVTTVWAVVISPLKLQRFYAAQSIRGRPWKPLLGDVPWIVSCVDSETEAAVHPWRNEHHKYGSIFSFFFGPGFRLRIADAVAAQDILVRHADKFRKPTIQTTMLGPLLGREGMLLAEGASHKHHRLASKSAFEFAGLQAMVPLMQEVASAALAAWLQSQQPQSTRGGSGDSGWTDIANAAPMISSLTLSIIGRVAFPTLKVSRPGDGGESPLADLPRASQLVILAATRLYVFLVCRPQWSGAQCSLASKLFVPHPPTPHPCSFAALLGASPSPRQPRAARAAC